MKPLRAAGGRPRLRLVPTPRNAVRQDGSPPVAGRTHVEHEPARCERCDAVYQRKTWRSGRSAPPDRVTWTLCPACVQIEEQEYFGRLSITRPLPSERETEVRRRIWNVERRARETQPERRLVRIEHTRTGIEVLTTSQKLAHRIAHELEKAFGGRAHYEWADRERVLDATWDPEAKPVHGAPLKHRTKT
jgi:hypothetical protein